MTLSTPEYGHLWNPETLADLFPLRKKGIPWLTYKTVEILNDYVQLVTVPERLVLYLKVYFLAVMRLLSFDAKLKNKCCCCALAR